MREMLIVTTGGSIDKTYNLEASEFQVGAPAVRRMLKSVGKLQQRIEVKELCRKDSLQLTDDDRAAIVKLVREAPQGVILITHGTDTIQQTALAVEQAAIEAQKVVVLTGALRPESFKETDAYFNFGSAVAVAPYLAPGAHVVFRGVVFSKPETLRKDGDTFVDDANPAP
eukprot:CAMPEP_0198659414 /NCGR_PEP_ID=MMETSP1467-20131203/31757_1 /TAXON_ID=1462469 /ORGANISM="unid. sp., Strain CCMP2135" /LENGTH=169 /DNA_ID=CAMNT_0044395763 /DNA_START=15 /DNA_END=521 /DNA_ORIENTATION=-